MSEKLYCGCCGNDEIENGGPQWCERCSDHIARWTGTPFARSYFAVHDEDCPFRITRDVDPVSDNDFGGAA